MTYVSPMQAVQNLCNAVIEQAAKDYTEAILKHDKRTMTALEHWFASEYFEFYSDLDGPTLASQIRHMVNRQEQEKKKRTNRAITRH